MKKDHPYSLTQTRKAIEVIERKRNPDKRITVLNLRINNQIKADVIKDTDRQNNQLYTLDEVAKEVVVE